MIFESRKFFVWLISLSAVLMVYLLYGRLSETDSIQVERTVAPIADGNDQQFGGQIGKVGDVGVANLKKAVYTHRDKNGEIDRVFGFEKLLRAVGDEWEIEKPFMNIFQDNLQCRLTADRGDVITETVVGETSPKDATLTGNVVIHVLPQGQADFKKSTIYMDEVVFVSERSQFSTDGPVRFVSENTQMLGKGLELIYNEELDRLEFLRIIHLKSLHIKAPAKTSLFAKDQTDTESAPTAAVEAEAERPSQAVTAQKGKTYKCLFSKNVIIDTPEQLIGADEIYINEIFLASASDKKPAEPNTAQVDTPRTDTTAPEQLPEEFIDVVVTCDGGITVTPMDSSGTYANSVETDTGPDSRALENLEDVPGRKTFTAQRIDYNVDTDDTVATGRSELTFDSKDVLGDDPNEAIVPVKVTASKKVRFLPASKQVVFEGDVRCTMTREGPASRQDYTLSAPRLTVNLTEEETAADIEHLTADGGTVRLSNIETAAGKTLGGVELKCARFDYNTARQMYLWTGPGRITVDNSKILEPKTKKGKFSLRKPCYAFLSNFQTVEYFSQTGKVIADAPPNDTLRIDYFPVVPSGDSPHVIATAGKIETFLYEDANGQPDISTLTAVDGITYQDEDKQFEGSEMFYDAENLVIRARGDEFQPCLLNGALVDGIEYDLKTGKIKTKVVGPGALRIR